MACKLTSEELHSLRRMARYERGGAVLLERLALTALLDEVYESRNAAADKAMPAVEVPSEIASIGEAMNTKPFDDFKKSGATSGSEALALRLERLEDRVAKLSSFLTGTSDSLGRAWVKVNAWDGKLSRFEAIERQMALLRKTFS